MDFFQNFPTIPYAFQTPRGNATLTLTNIAAHVQIIARAKEAMWVFYDYVIQDGDRPDTVAVKVYNDAQYTWVVLMLNNIFTLFDWPLTQRELDLVIAEKYGSLTNAKSAWLYRTVAGFWLDHTSYTALPAAQQGVPQTSYDWEIDQNEAKRRIKVVPAQFLTALTSELKKAFSL